MAGGSRQSKQPTKLLATGNRICNGMWWPVQQEIWYVDGDPLESNQAKLKACWLANNRSLASFGEILNIITGSCDRLKPYQDGPFWGYSWKIWSPKSLPPCLKSVTHVP